ncbi:MAG: ABC transporter ATP-binding protein [Paracoccus sp. (in: a-proteobacteria)]|uniref:ABC transporter ATP-binding protein n=1 Tax=Paracoccus sp. TaxID=267 RepID=UPI0039E6F48F
MSQPNASRPLVRFDDVCKSYDGTVQVVDHLNLTIDEGEFLTLLGPSGSGKTTTLMMLAGFEKPSAGDVSFNGSRINDTPTYRRNFGMVFQNYALFPHMSVAQNLAFPLRMHKFPKSEIEGRVKRALDMIKLDKVADRRPIQLSGGQQQRVALARALVFEPRMVLLDEPLGALDKQLREHMQLEIRELHDRLGLTMLYVTHDQSEALTMSDRVAIFNEGRIQHIGPPDEVYDRPRTAFVARFMGENNAIEGKVAQAGDGGVVLRTPEGAEIRALAQEGLAQGAAAQVLVRPENVRLGAAEDGANRFPARVRDVIYHGDHLRAVLDVERIGPVTAYVPRGLGARRPAVGDTVGVWWQADRALAFAAGN